MKREVAVKTLDDISRIPRGYEWVADVIADCRDAVQIGERLFFYLALTPPPAKVVVSPYELEGSMKELVDYLHDCRFSLSLEYESELCFLVIDTPKPRS